VIEHKRYGQKGRPTGGTPLKAIEWQMQARVKPDAERLEGLKQHKACSLNLSLFVAAQNRAK
jgi:hypothetical protein